MSLLILPFSEKVCTGTFTNGILDTSCSQTVGSSCRVTCNEDFVNIVDEVACLDDGTWSLDVVCKRMYLKCFTI